MHKLNCKWRPESGEKLQQSHTKWTKIKLYKGARWTKREGRSGAGTCYHIVWYLIFYYKFLQSWPKTNKREQREREGGRWGKGQPVRRANEQLPKHLRSVEWLSWRSSYLRANWLGIFVECVEPLKESWGRPDQMIASGFSRDCRTEGALLLHFEWPVSNSIQFAIACSAQ